METDQDRWRADAARQPLHSSPWFVVSPRQQL